MGYWAKAPMKREQMVLFAPTLDSTIPEGHPVRLFDEIHRISMVRNCQGGMHPGNTATHHQRSPGYGNNRCRRGVDVFEPGYAHR